MDVAKTLEWATITGATALLFFLGFLSIPILYSIQEPTGEPDVTIKLTASQWAWEFEYPDGSTSDRLIVRAGDLVRLQMTSKDVIHSFFVRDLGFKIDLLPAETTEIWFQADEPGEYWIQCAEFCGRFHGSMRTKLVVESGI